MNAKYILGAAAAVFVIGGGMIVYYGRPVMKLPAPEAAEVSVVVVGEPTGGAVAVAPVVEPQVSLTPTPTPGTYTLATVATHNTEADCWSAINGSVYDLTSWVSRHPGGTKPILNLCGKDGSAAFTRKHNAAPKPQAALILLKIGTLQS